MKRNRIVSLAPSNTEIVFALGENNKLVGVTEFCNFPPEARSIDKIGGFSTPCIEKIISLKPDLALAVDFHSNMPFISQLKDAGVDTCIIETKTILDVPESIRRIGAVLGKEKKADRLAGEIEIQIERIKEKTMRLAPEEKPKVCYICSDNPLRIGRHRCCVELFIETAGGLSIGSQIPQDETIGLDFVAEMNPDVIIAGKGHGETTDLAEFIRNEAILRRTNAYKNNRIYKISADLLRFGPRAIDGLGKFFQFIHPKSVGRK